MATGVVAQRTVRLRQRVVVQLLLRQPRLATTWGSIYSGCSVFGYEENDETAANAGKEGRVSWRVSSLISYKLPPV